MVARDVMHDTRPVESGKSTTLARRIKQWALRFTVALVAEFAFRNLLSVSVRFLFWNVEISRFARLASTFAIGGARGFLARGAAAARVL